MTTNELKEILLCCVCINSYRVYFGQIVSYIKADSRQFINPLRDLTFCQQDQVSVVTRDFSSRKDAFVIVKTIKESHQRTQIARYKSGKNRESVRADAIFISKNKLPERIMKPIATIIVALICPLAHATNSDQQAFMNATTEYIGKYIAVPCETPQTAEIRVQLESFPNGYLKSISVVQSSGYPQYDKAVLKAIAIAQPLPAAKPDMLKVLGSSVMYFWPGIPTYRCNLQPLDGEIPNLKLNDLPVAPNSK